jgi:hypothetical protein
MKKIKIILDCDEVLVPTMNQYRSFVKSNFGKSIPLVIYDFENVEAQMNNTDRADIMHYWEEFNISDAMAFVKPYPGAIKFVDDYQEHEIHIVTSRPARTTELSTAAWVDRFFGKMVNNIHHCNTYDQELSTKRSKSKVIAEITQGDPFIYIEDTHTHILDVADNCPAGTNLLLKKDWNKSRYIAHDRVIRADDWNIIHSFVDQFMAEVLRPF